jgi:hypothetical protein
MDINHFTEAYLFQNICRRGLWFFTFFFPFIFFFLNICIIFIFYPFVLSFLYLIFYSYSRRVFIFDWDDVSQRRELLIHLMGEAKYELKKDRICWVLGERS